MSDRQVWVDADVVSMVHVDDRMYAEIDIIVDGVVAERVMALIPDAEVDDDGETVQQETSQASEDGVCLSEPT